MCDAGQKKSPYGQCSIEEARRLIRCLFSENTSREMQLVAKLLRWWLHAYHLRTVPQNQGGYTYMKNSCYLNFSMSIIFIAILEYYIIDFVRQSHMIVLLKPNFTKSHIPNSKPTNHLQFHSISTKETMATRILAVPGWLIILRGLQLLFSLIVLGMAAYGASWVAFQVCHSLQHASIKSSTHNPY